MKYNLFVGFAILSVFVLISAQVVDKKAQKNTAKALNDNYSLISADSLIEHDFIIFKTEVSNFEYKAFLSDLKQSGDLEKYERAKIDTSRWSDEKWTNKAYETYYHSHIAYRDFPVVNISKEGAELFCQWVSEKVNNSLGESAKLVFRLPTQREWIKAAKGKLVASSYAWSGTQLIDKEGNSRCNFLNFGSECITRDENGKLGINLNAYNNYSPTIDHSDVTAPVKSYWPNAYDLYNMNGNVAELIADKSVVVGGSWNDPGYDVRNESERPYLGASRTVGFRMVATVVPAECEWLKVSKKE
jgi:formylglycine-generating enzyme required for sulfatase activity